MENKKVMKDANLTKEEIVEVSWKVTCAETIKAKKFFLSDHVKIINWRND